jgi:nucleoside-diphosphate-sugar epimerase
MSLIENQRIVVLGAAGFIGFHLSVELSKIKGVSLVIVDNYVRGLEDPAYKSLSVIENVQALNLDLSIESSYENLFQKGDYVINCAALNGTQNFYNFPVQVIRNSAITSILAAEYASKIGVDKYIYFGTPESYASGVDLGIITIPTPENVPLIIESPLNLRWSYAASKTIGEVASIANLEQFGLNSIILRVHNIYGPRMGKNHVIPDLVEKFLNGNFEVHGINETRAFMYIDDLIPILIKLIFETIELKNRIFHIGSSKEILIADLADLIMKELKIEGRVIPVKNFAGSVSRRLPDTSLISEYFSYKETELQSGIQKYIAWYKENTKQGI